ncbi:hypothetical protein VTJ04DRAFT_7990 [Mycothermus thermophilus]|uniref:uncharacterized protein n=1 Tax=Humicola insolens TaxID=85995 RepID=UPI003742945B
MVACVAFGVRSIRSIIVYSCPGLGPRLDSDNVVAEIHTFIYPFRLTIPERGRPRYRPSTTLLRLRAVLTFDMRPY